MASISKGADGNVRLRFFDASGNRRTIYLGKTPIKYAQQVCRHVERIVIAEISRCSLETETANWLKGVEEVLRGKLHRVGLIQARESAVLEAFIDQYIAGRNDAKAATKTVRSSTKSNRYVSSNDIYTRMPSGSFKLGISRPERQRNHVFAGVFNTTCQRATRYRENPSWGFCVIRWG